MDTSKSKSNKSKSRRRLQVSHLQEDYEQLLASAIKRRTQEQPAALLFPSRLSTLLTYLLPHGLAVLESCHVQHFVSLNNDSESARISTPHLVYLASSGCEDIRSVALHVQRLQSSYQVPDRAFHLLVFGVWNGLCEQIVQQFPLVHSALSIDSVPIGFVPLDCDLFTLGLERCLYDCCIPGNKTSLVTTGQALNLLQQRFGRYSTIKYKGKLAMNVVNELLQRVARNSDPTATSSESSQTHGNTTTLVVLDRLVDLVTPLCVPLTYEALIDELMQIRDGYVTLSDKNANDRQQEGQQEQEKSFALNSQDDVFERIRDLHVEAVPSLLRGEATSVKSTFEAFQQSSGTMQASELQEFVMKVPQLKERQEQIARHVSVLEALQQVTNSKAFADKWTFERAIMDENHHDTGDSVAFLQQMIFRQEPMLETLRMVCLLSAVRGGIDSKNLHTLKYHFVRTYGYELVFSLENLSRVGFLQSTHTDAATSSSAFKTANWFFDVTAKLGLIDTEVDVHNPKNAAFVTSGFMPITCRLVEEILKVGNWRKLLQPLSRLNGPVAEIALTNGANKGKKPSKTSRVVVCFVGGVSYVEIAAIRWITRFYPYEVVITTTNVLSGGGGSLLSQLFEPIPRVRDTQAQGK